MDAIKTEIAKVTAKIDYEELRLECAVERFKDAASKSDAYSIETFIPGMVKEVADIRARIQAFREQKSMLEYVLNQIM